MSTAVLPVVLLLPVVLVLVLSLVLVLVLMLALVGSFSGSSLHNLGSAALEAMAVLAMRAAEQRARQRPRRGGAVPALELGNAPVEPSLAVRQLLDFLVLSIHHIFQVLQHLRLGLRRMHAVESRREGSAGDEKKSDAEHHVGPSSLPRLILNFMKPFL